MLDDLKYSEEVTLRKVINKFGKEAQCRQTMEECAELIQATNKMLRNDADRENLITEMSDVLLMIDQLKIMFKVKEREITKERFNTIEELKRMVEE